MSIMICSFVFNSQVCCNCTSITKAISKKLMKPISNSYQVAAIIQQSKKVFIFMVIAQTQIALCILSNEQFIEKSIDYLVSNSLRDILNQ
jgi:hypothetical protein